MAPGRRCRCHAGGQPAGVAGAAVPAAQSAWRAGVDAAERQQVVVGPALHEAAPVEHQDPVGRLGGRQAVGDRDRGPRLRSGAPWPAGSGPRGRGRPPRSPRRAPARPGRRSRRGPGPPAAVRPPTAHRPARRLRWRAPRASRPASRRARGRRTPARPRRRRRRGARSGRCRRSWRRTGSPPGGRTPCGSAGWRT